MFLLEQFCNQTKGLRDGPNVDEQSRLRAFVVGEMVCICVCFFFFFIVGLN